MGAVPRGKLAAILARLDSPYEGERAAAGFLAARMVREAGITWHELLAASGPQTAAEALPWQSMVTACRACPGRLTAWEIDFVGQLAGYTREPSERQLSILAGIAAKAAA